MGESAVVRFLKELRRRRVFRVAGLYVVAMWLLMQAANILFPAWGIPDAAINFLLWAGLLGFPVALVFGWVFDISMAGLRRTQPVGSDEELLQSLPLRRTDYVILSAFLLVAAAIVYDTTGRVLETTTATGTGALAEWRPSMAEIEPSSVAVLPFANLSADPEHEYFADGISEEILNRLSAFRELKVIARTSSFAFKESGYDIGRISGLLAVNYLLQGSVRRDGQQLRISAQLVDRAGVQVWSSTFDRQLGAIFAMQDEIAEAVANSIVPQIVPPASKPRLPDLDAYQEYLAGREILASRRQYQAEQALARLDRAVELDPMFAEPYAERAIARLLAGEQDFDQVQQDIDRAFVLKPDFPRAHTAQAYLMLRRDPANHEAREHVLRRSLALDPNQVDAWNWLHMVMLTQEREDEAIQALSQALRLDPLAPAALFNMALYEIRSGSATAGEQRLLRAIDSPLAYESHYFGLILLYLGSGRLAEALAMAERTILWVAAEQGRPSPLLGMININALLGRQDTALEFVQKNRESHPDDAVMRVWEQSVLGVDNAVQDRSVALSELERLLPGGRLDVPGTWNEPIGRYGELLALEGRYQEAIALLQGMPSGESGPARAFRGRQALLWASLQSGEHDLAAEVLDALLDEYRTAVAAGEGRLFDFFSGYLTGGLGGYALATLVSGDEDKALALLGQAADEGWRGYYGIQRDPRWDVVRDDPRFQAILARVKAEIDVQRSQVEAREADEDFDARLQAAIAAHAESPPESDKP